MSELQGRGPPRTRLIRKQLDLQKAEVLKKS
jgi:hypothetical protein